VYDLVADLPAERLGAIYASLPDGARAALAGSLAQVLHARPQKVPRLPMEMQVKALRACLKRTRNDELAQELLGAYFLGPRKDLVVRFLDATGVEHEDGQVEGDAAPDEGRVESAVKTLLDEHDTEDVLLYLRIARHQWPKSEAVAKQCEALAAR